VVVGRADRQVHVCADTLTRCDRWLAVVLAVVGMASSRGAAARPPSVVVDQRLVGGVGDVRGLSLGVVGAGARWSPTPTLDLQIEAVTLRTAGSVPSGEPAPIGYGGDASFRVAPWSSRRPLRPYLGAGLGVLVFPERPLLPGGAAYDGLVTFSLGIDARLGPNLTAGARAMAVHLSNGQGLGRHNPAYDGFGSAIELVWEPGRQGPLQERVAAPDRRTGRERLGPGVVIDGAMGRFAEGLLATARARVTARLSRDTLALFDLECGSADRLAFGEVGGALVAHLGPASFGAHGGYRGFAGASIGVATIQVEGHVTPELSLIVMGHHEGSHAFGRVERAALGARAFPVPEIALDIGLGFDRIGDDAVFGQDHVDPYLGFEWRLPWRLDELTFSLFLERQVSTLDLAGLRIAFDTGSDPRAFARYDGWRRLR